MFPEYNGSAKVSRVEPLSNIDINNDKNKNKNMSKSIKKRKLFAGALIFTMTIALYGIYPLVNSASAVDSIINASDTLSDSDVSQTSLHTIDFTTTHNSVASDDDYIEVVWPDSPQTFGNITAENSDCGSGNWNETVPDTHTLRCTSSGGDNAAGSYTFSATTTNPSSEGSQLITITHYDGDTGEELERVQVRVYIIDDVWMTARVDATLEFSVSGVASSTSFNGVTCTRDTTATTTDFGTLEPTVPETVCQALAVTTNADDGYIVTVEQDQELTSDSGSNINSFNDSPDGTGSTTPGAWEAPSGILDVYNTYGHMGLTSDDSDLASLGGYNDFTSTAYAGLNGSDPMVVMHHDGPADGSTADKGAANIAYTAEITSLQEAGDYENTLTYIATPTY